MRVSGRRVYVLTAYHVIQADSDSGAPSVELEFYQEGRGEGRISKERMDARNDLAILVVDKLPGSPPPEISWGSSAALLDTERVWAIGQTRLGPNWLVSDGIVSRKTGGKVYFSGTASTDAGNSGGPLLNGHGALVGVITSKGGSTGIALEADVVRPIIRDWMPAPVPGPTPPPTAATPGPTPPPAITPRPAAPAPTPAGPPPVIKGKDGKEMVLVPAGTFTMGSSEAEIEAAYQLAKRYFASVERSAFTDEGPAHPVQLDAYYIDRQEVTVQEYRVFQQATGHRALPGDVATYAPGGQSSGGEGELGGRGGVLPVGGEGAADGGAVGEGGPGHGRAAVSLGERAGRRAAGELLRPELQGIVEGHEPGRWLPVHGAGGELSGGAERGRCRRPGGNVWEWVRDCYAADYYGRSPTQNPLNDSCGKDALRVVRGGGWDGYPADLRAAERVRGAPGVQLGSLGVRCVVGRVAPQN